MEHMDTVVDAIAALEQEGYEAQMAIDESGNIVSGDRHWTADEVTVERTIRFEGMSDPDDESMVMAVRTDDGSTGTLTLPYGPDATGSQADTVRALVIKRDGLN